MSTPNLEGEDILRDLELTVLTLRRVLYVDRFELNISCPNTHSSTGENTVSEYQNQLDDMLKVVSPLVYPEQDLYVKVSPDTTIEGVKEILDVIEGYKIKGITASNTTTKHNQKYIPRSPGEGGASGEAVYQPSRLVQLMFHGEINKRGMDLDLIAVGGIDSTVKLKNAIGSGAKEIQIYTPFIFRGPQILREFKQYLHTKKS